LIGFYWQRIPKIRSNARSKKQNWRQVYKLGPISIIAKSTTQYPKMKQKVSKSEAEKQIEEFFKNIKNKTPAEIKKIKKLAMSKRIRLKDKRKTFCKYCLHPFSGAEKIRIKKGRKIIVCKNCGKISRWKLKREISEG